MRTSSMLPSKSHTGLVEAVAPDPQVVAAVIDDVLAPGVGADLVAVEVKDHARRGGDAGDVVPLVVEVAGAG
jgi:hypothetical protein